MRLAHPDYIKLVIEAYKQKRTNNDLSLLLAQSTPANIKKECVNVYKERFQKKDELTLRAFFGPAEQGRHFLQLIQGFETDRFRPLDNYLKGKNDKTDDKNVELLAWLIDFVHRPYVFDKNFSLTEEEITLIQNSREEQPELGKEFVHPKREEKEETVIEQQPAEKNLPVEVKETVISKNEPATILLAAPTTKASRNIFKKAGVIFLSLLICFIGVFTMGFPEKVGEMILGNSNTGCMYWVNDHYEKVLCSKEKEMVGQLLLPLNEEKIKNFKKITREDTITEKSIGVIYYLKTDNKPEYFTAEGNHPVFITRTLKVLSPHIYDKYLRKNDSVNKDSVRTQNLNLQLTGK